MSDHEKCERCEEPIEPVSLSKLPLIGRFTGKVSVDVTKRTVHLTSIRQRLSPMGAYEKPEFSRTDVTLCDQCWGAFLSWVTEPGQERAKIAAENRRKDQRLREVAEQRREAQVQRPPQGSVMTTPEGYYATVRDEEDFDRYAEDEREDQGA